MTIRSTAVPGILYILLLVILPGARSHAQDFLAPQGSDSLSTLYKKHVREMTSPELAHRTAARLALQRSGYCHILAGVVRQNGLDGLIAYMRMKLLLEFSLPHDQLLAYFTVTEEEKAPAGFPSLRRTFTRTYSIPLEEDRAFPADPWSREHK